MKNHYPVWLKKFLRVAKATNILKRSLRYSHRYTNDAWQLIMWKTVHYSFEAFDASVTRPHYWEHRLRVNIPRAIAAGLTYEAYEEYLEELDGSGSIGFLISTLIMDLLDGRSDLLSENDQCLLTLREVIWDFSDLPVRDIDRVILHALTLAVRDLHKSRSREYRDRYFYTKSRPEPGQTPRPGHYHSTCDGCGAILGYTSEHVGRTLVRDDYFSYWVQCPRGLSSGKVCGHRTPVAQERYAFPEIQLPEFCEHGP